MKANEEAQGERVKLRYDSEKASADDVAEPSRSRWKPIPGE